MGGTDVGTWGLRTCTSFFMTGRSSVDEPIEAARKAKDAASERLELAIVRAYLDQRPVAQIARMAGLTRPTIYAILRRRSVIY